MTDKGRILAFPDTAAIEAEAAAWVARFDAGDVSAKDQAAFQEWLNRSALHREAIAEYGDLWSEFDALRLLTDTDEAGRETGARDNHPAMLEESEALACGMRGGCHCGRGRDCAFPPKAPGSREGRESSVPATAFPSGLTSAFL